MFCGSNVNNIEISNLKIMGTKEIKQIVIPDEKDSICRFCLKLSDNLFDISDCKKAIKWPKAGKISLQKLFAKLHLKIDYAKDLPKRICNHCKDCLEEFFLFVENIESNEEILRAIYVKEECNSSPKDNNIDSCINDRDNLAGKFEKERLESFPDNVIESEHDYSQKNSILANCLDIPKELEDANLYLANELSEFLIKNHETSVQNEDDPVFTNCSRINENNEETTSTDQTESPEIDASSPKLPIEQEDEQIIIKQCSFCEQQFSNDDLKTVHYFQHVIRGTKGIVSQRPICSLCGLLTETKEKLTEHVQLVHQNEAELNCYDCKIRFSIPDELIKHIDKHHVEIYEDTDAELKCLICSKLCDDTESLMLHSLEHVYRRHTCRACKNIYMCAAALNEHRRSHPWYKQKCPICKRWLIGRTQEIKRHLETHSITKKYKCKICNKSYSSRSHFIYHNKNHNSKSGHVCHQCGYTTKVHETFNTHMRIHSNERPFKCTFDECGMAFRTNSSLSSHVKKHLKIHNFACEFCDYRTDRSISLRYHRRVHTGERPYRCDLCRKGFSKLWNLKSHLKRVHLKTD